MTYLARTNPAPCRTGPHERMAENRHAHRLRRQLATLEDRCGSTSSWSAIRSATSCPGQTIDAPVTIEHMVYAHRMCGASAKCAPWSSPICRSAAYHGRRSRRFAMPASSRRRRRMVKLEGGAVMAGQCVIARTRSAPSIGLTPQSVHALGGYRVQGDDAGAARMKADALALEQAGAATDRAGNRALAARRRYHPARSRSVPPSASAPARIATVRCWCCYDMLGLYPGKKGRFVKDFMVEAQSIEGAVTAYVEAVKDGSFPAQEHCY